MTLLLRLGTGNAASGRRPGGVWDLGPWAAAAATLAVDVLAVQELDRGLPRSGGADQAAQVAAALQAVDGGAPWSVRFAPAVLGTPGSHRTMRPAPGPAEGGVADGAAADGAAGDGEAGSEPEGAYGVALLSRHRVVSWHELRMAPSTARMPVPDEQRVALAAVVDAPAGPVTVVTTHLSFVPRRAAAQLRELVAWTAALPRPLVLLGDLNLPAPLPGRLSGWAAGPRGATFPAARPMLQLDHVLLDPGRLPGRLAGGRTQRLAGSDHLAVRADLLLG